MQERLACINAALRGLGPNAYALANARLLITGARGFFGRYVVDALLKLNATALVNTPVLIHAMDSFATGDAQTAQDWLNQPNLIQHKHDVRHEIGNPMLGGPPLTHVWHLAGIASPYWYKKLPEETIAVAVDGTRNMLRLAQEHGAKFLFTSSSEVYATADIVPTPESYIGAIPSLTERSSYDVSKLLAETLCYVAATKHGQHCTVVRIFNSFGPGMSEKDRRILPRIASAMKAQRSMTVYKPRGGSSLPRRTYTPVANTLLGFLLAAVRGESVGNASRTAVTSSTGVYNIGLDSPELTVPELIHRCVMASGNELAYTLEAAPEHYQTEPMRRCPDITKLVSLGFRPAMDLDEGLAHFFKWARSEYTGIE